MVGREVGAGCSQRLPRVHPPPGRGMGGDGCWEEQMKFADDGSSLWSGGERRTSVGACPTQRERERVKQTETFIYYDDADESAEQRTGAADREHRLHAAADWSSDRAHCLEWRTCFP